MSQICYVLVICHCLDINFLNNNLKTLLYMNGDAMISDSDSIYTVSSITSHLSLVTLAFNDEDEGEREEDLVPQRPREVTQNQYLHHP